MTNRSSALFALALFTFGCGKSTGTGQLDSGDASSGPTCETSVDSTVPMNGSMDHYYRDPIVFHLSGPDETATVVTDIVGETRFEDDGATVVFTPQGNLSASTEYTIGLDYCFGQPEISFTTSHFGAPLEASADLEGRTFALDVNSGEYTTGENAGELLNSLFTRPLLIQLRGVDGPYLEIIAALGQRDMAPPAQDTCARTIELSNVAINDLPYVTGGVEDFEFGAQGGLLRFASFDFQATISSDAESIGGIGYQAVMGVPEIVALLPEFGDLTDVCNLTENLGIPCEVCPDGSGDECISISATSIEANIVQDASLVSIVEPGTHEDCETVD